MPHMPADAARAAMAASYRALSGAVDGLSEDDLAAWSLCRGWTRADVLFHTLLDARRALVTFATPAAGEPDVDFVSYWAPFRPGEAGSAEHARFVRRVAASYPSNVRIAREWAGAAAAAIRSAGPLPAGLKVATQGHVLLIGDFLATLAVEASIHHLDLALGDDLSGPSGEGLAAVRRTLDGVLGGPAPADWDDATYALKGTGRAGLTTAEHARLGARAARFPLLG